MQSYLLLSNNLFVSSVSIINSVAFVIIASSFFGGEDNSQVDNNNGNGKHDNTVTSILMVRVVDYNGDDYGNGANLKIIIVMITMITMTSFVIVK